MSLMSNVGSQFVLIGDIGSQREGKSDKSGREWFYFTIRTAGAKFDVQVPKEFYHRFTKGDGVKITGELDLAFEKIALVAQKVEAVTGGGAAAPGVAR